MGTRGYMAYRYNGKYYRVYLKNSAYPSGYGEGYASDTPRHPVRLKNWMEKNIETLEGKEHRAELFGWEGQDVCISPDWTLGSLFIEWTYVFDFDNRVFTVNGAVHFPFDSMPPLEASESELGFVGYLESHKRVEIPSKYLTTINLWPPPRFDVTQARQRYDGLQPLVVVLVEWGAPTWDSLSVSQSLSTVIVKALVHDYSDELTLAHYSSVWHKIGLFCWQVANAAAPSHLICPPLDASPLNSVLYVRTDLVRAPRANGLVRSIHYHLGGKGTLGRYCWFRGCLVTFCPRVDEPSQMAHQVHEMVQRLRSHGRKIGVGVIMSGWHIVAVAINGAEVRHSPALELHDGKELKDGVLLLIHLLSPAYTTLKTPWSTEPSIHQAGSIYSILPDDIIQQIIHFTDLETYLSLRLVSRSTRLICLSHPRVGHHILLSFEGTPTSEPVFRVRSTASTCSTLATLTRIKSSIDEPYPIWMFRSKHYSKSVLNPGLVGTLQYHQSGNGPLDTNLGEDNNSKAPKYRHQRTLFRDIIKQDTFPDMRIQAVDGIWAMVVRVSDAAQISETNQSSPRGRGLYELMTGFESSDLDEMSEVEARYPPS